MRNILFGIALLFTALACDDSISYELARPVAGKQKVLVEEISGVRCPNCPDGSRLLESLNDDFDSSLIVVTYHAGSFSIPYEDSKYDFKTDQSVALMEMLGRPEGYPSAVIQRKANSGDNRYQRLSNTWTSAITAELGGEPIVELTILVDTVDAITILKVSALFLKEVNTPVFMTAYLTEDGLIDPQADSRSKEEYVVNFQHNHVLREILTPVKGRKWADGFKALDFKEDEIHVDLNSISQIVDPGKTSFVVFVHSKDGVLQVEKI